MATETDTPAGPDTPMETASPTGPNTPGPNPTSSPSGGAWAALRILLRQQRRRFLTAASELDLHPAQAGALLHLDSPRPMTELATVLACDNSNVTGLVDRLEARGLVARRSTPGDRRVKHVVLTAAGSDVRAQLVERVERPPAGFARLSAAEQRHLRDLLCRVVDEPGGELSAGSDDGS